ncbi:MAG: DMT family transporter [Anaerolineales bacterium]|nr:DMT family transporter [Chloroflexota bacterium]MBL6983941.1 DMT family transporter [Anaerolineales bacterium]
MNTKNRTSSKPRSVPKAYFAFGFGILALGFSAIFVRAADAPGTVTAFYRMAIGSALVVLPFLNQARREPVSQKKGAIWLAILGGVFFGLDLSFWSTGIVMSGASIPTLMANTAPVWVGLGALFIFREKQRKNFWVGLLVAMVGAAIILGQDFSLAANIGIGSALGLCAAVFYGAYYLVTQRARAHVRTLPYFWITTTSSAVFLFVVNFIFGHSLIDYDKSTYLNFLGIGVLVQVFGWLAINYAQGFFSAPIIAATLLAQPVLTAILAWLFFGEAFTPWQIIGGIAVIGGVYLVHRSRTGIGEKPSPVSGPSPSDGKRTAKALKTLD